VNPGDEIKDVEEDMRASWRSCGLVVASYTPGRMLISVDAPGKDSLAPTAKKKNMTLVRKLT